jgi:hypothetical protein
LKEEDSSTATGNLSPIHSPFHGSRQSKHLLQHKTPQQHQDQSFPDYVITFRQTFPLHVYAFVCFVVFAIMLKRAHLVIFIQLRQTCGRGRIIFTRRKSKITNLLVYALNFIR